MPGVILFISSYIPLYVLLIFKNILERSTDGGRFNITYDKFTNAVFFDEVNDYAICLLVILILVAFIYLKILIRDVETTHYYEVIKVEDKTSGIYFNYISVYLLSCLGLSLNKIVDIFVLFFMMCIVGYLYIKNHMTFMNPVLQFLGYRIYEGEVKSLSLNKTMHAIMITNKPIIVSKGYKYLGSGSDDFLFISEMIEK